MNNIEIRYCPSTFRNEISKFRVSLSDECFHCGLCVEICPYGVFERVDGLNFISTPRSFNCVGPDCKKKPFYCIKKCPVEAINIELDPQWKTLGDFRWTPDLIITTWQQAETGEIPNGNFEYKFGASEGGFDKFDFINNNHSSIIWEEVDKINTSISLNRRSEGNSISIPIPWYGAGMSFGSISLPTMLARAMAAKAWETFTSTGEGGYPDELIPYMDHVITQIATGLFGVREETIKRARILEFKYAQGAKPGLGGHLLGDKNTPAVAKMREAVPWTSLFSPFPFHSVYSVEDHKKHIDWVKQINPEALISVKVSTPSDVDMVAVGSYYAGANIIHLDGGYGGTGAAPEIAKKNIAMPIEYAITKVHKFLLGEGVRDEIVLMASGGIRNAYDIAKAIALGADGAIIGTAELVVLGCVRCGNCESGRGCPRGIATTDPELDKQISPSWGAQRIINLYAVWQKQLKLILYQLGLKDINELRGRTDFLRYADEK
ncbi:MAG: glutamate synthase-related protein [Acidobacteriota bacterium]